MLELQLLSSVDVQSQNVLLCLINRGALEGVLLRSQVVKRAAEGPRIDFGAGLFLALNELGRGVAEVARVDGALDQLFEVVGQPHHVELHDAVQHVHARRVHVPVDDSQGVQMRNCRAHLAEDAESMEQRHLSFAELLPRADVVWTLGLDHQGLNVLQQDGFLHKP